MRASSPGERAKGDYRSRQGRFQHLMSYHVQDILLVTSLYDSFILAEDADLGELVLTEFLDLNLRHTPELTHVSTGERALALATEHRRHDLIISSLNLGDMNVLELARKVREAGLDTPVVLLAYDARELKDFMASNDTSGLERIFLWQGDVRILLAVVKYIEDRRNLAHDTGQAGVPAIVVVEDKPRFYSSFLPVIYTELMQHAHSLMPEGLNRAHKLMRIRARPKVLLCQTYEEAWGFIREYPDEILGLITDIEFPHDGRLDPLAGVELARQVRGLRHDIPIMLQSGRPENEKLAHQAGASFLLKDSPVLLQQLRDFMVNGFGFGDFVFRLPSGSEVDRAHDLEALIEKLWTVPGESIAYHAARNHFSRWLKTRTEFALAENLRPWQLSDFEGVEELRHYLIRAMEVYRREQSRGIVVDYERARFDGSVPFTRIGSGSLGGKARGLAFVNYLLRDYDATSYFPGVRITVPPCVVLGTDVFDDFLNRNRLRDFAIEHRDHAQIQKRFLAARFPESVERDLAVFLAHMKQPLAVRSSSLLEDNQYQPFAGIYRTFMLPNNHEDPDTALARLITAIKRVYASTFSPRAKAYLDATPYRLEEEKMAVIVQRVVGAQHGGLYYPNFAGVARSHNFYPTAPFSSQDGIAAVALGFGRTVGEGERCLRFCPRYPRHVLQFSSVQEFLNSSQREFWALEVRGETEGVHDPDDDRMVRLGLEHAERHGTLHALGSTYSPENDAVYDGLARPGVRLVSFAPVLKQEIFPLADVLDYLLDLGEQATSAPVEIEFAVNLSVPKGEPIEFGYLQMRPLALSRELEELEIGDMPDTEVVCRSASVLGNGKVDDLRDLVVVDYHRFERSKSRVVAEDVAHFNAALQAKGLNYILIGVGRWGSTDPFLGIPVAWSQIAGARVIVEAGFKDFKVSPSQGTHFFQNLTSCNVGYFTVNPEAGEGYIDWEWLSSRPAAGERGCVRHVRLDEPLTVKMSGRKGEGVILKPGVEDPNESGR